MDKDSKIFKNKTFSNVLEDIYNNSQEKRGQINALIGELKPLINNLNDATMVVPLIKEYLEVAVKNDEHLVKLAAVVQRMIQQAEKKGKEAGDGFSISQADIDQIMSETDKLVSEKLSSNVKMESIEKKTAKISSAGEDSREK